ncbi:Crp/Fnr family transcriptional regulator, partial|uniref:Crp/Fnr family transcriptional regulator n=1 Tax=Escherichia coli TaxID=562 RepID=UPI001443CA9E
DHLANVSRHFTRIPLIQGEVLFESEGHLQHVHFPLSGLVSIVALMDDGTAIEAATIGPEGAVGLVQALGTGRVFWRALVQIPGEAMRIERVHLQAIIAESEVLREVASRYTEAMLMQALQLVACNALH